jgi:transcriptional regulator of acetoin/glycerol metabolism
MKPSEAPLPSPASADRLARARERFLTYDRVSPGEVRETILASWYRSREWQVAADRVSLSYTGDPDLETPLARSAVPVMRNLHEHLDGQPISIILTDAAGVVLHRLTADRDLERHLDGVLLAPGFSYAENKVGTNGIGTALEGGQPAHVFGHEHYAEDLEDLACAGVPVHDPLSGKTIGAIDLTCWRKDADALLVALAKTTADQISAALMTRTSARECALLHEYLRACRHSNGIVLALAPDMVMMNDIARQVLFPADQAALLGHAAEVLGRPQRGTAVITLPSGSRARLQCRAVMEGREASGVILVKLIEPATQPAPRQPGSRGPMFLPGLVGSAPLWLRGCSQVEKVHAAGEWLALEGEPGVGKLAVARAVHQRRNPAGRFSVLDAADATGLEWLTRVRRELLESQGTLVLRHVDRLGARQFNTLTACLQEARTARQQHALWVVVTLDGRKASRDLTKVLRFFPSTVELPPLRHHIEDLHELVPFFLARLGQQARLRCSPEAMQILLRSRWPGNVEQLWQVLRRIARRRRTGMICPADLPAECWTVSRRLLSPLESMERDAIVQGLLAYQGNKVKTAISLGMSRATIYRKIREYGIVVPGD